MRDGEITDGNQQESDTKARQPLTSSSTRPTSNPGQPHGSDVPTNTNGQPEDTESPWFRNPDWWMVILTALTLLVAAITLRVFWRQFREMQTQTGILSGQAQQATSDSGGWPIQAVIWLEWGSSRESQNPHSNVPKSGTLEWGTHPSH